MKAFLSSTFVDLKEHRHEAAQSLKRLGQQVGQMEIFGARPDEPLEACLSEIDDADLFVGIYAHRYGFIPAGTDVSITEREFDHAVAHHKRIFAFVVEDDFPWRPSQVDAGAGKARLEAFKGRLKALRVVDDFTTPHSLALGVATSVGRFLAQHRVDGLAAKVRKSLGTAGLDSTSLAKGATVPARDRADLVEVLDQLRESLDRLPPSTKPPTEDAPEALLALAQGLMADRRWMEAGLALKEYAKQRPEDWEASYLRGVAFANTRSGRNGDIEAIRAYNDAIVYAPVEAEPYLRPRLFAYRGALFKRLGRLDEAEADLLFAQTKATGAYEIDDIRYNLACVFAMRGDRTRLMSVMATLPPSSTALPAIGAHLHDYFRLFADDEEFLARLNR